MREAGGEERGRPEATIPISKDALHDHHGEVIWGAPADSFDGDGDVGSGNVVVSDTHFRSDEGSFGVSEAAEGNWVRRDRK